MQFTNEHIKGLLFAAMGAMFLTPDGLLVRLVEGNDWTIVFWRGVVVAGVIFAIQLSKKNVQFKELFPKSWKEWLSAFLAGLGTITFVLSITHTTVANALVILSVMSLFAALLSMIFLKERIALRTWIAMIIAIGGIIVVFLDDIDSKGMMGNMFALGCALVTAMNMTVIRSEKSLNVANCFGWGGVIVAVIAFIFSPDLVVESTASYAPLFTMGLFSALAFMCLGAGAKRIPAPEVTLLMLLETILGPVWVWAVLSEEPSVNALIGGALVVGTLLLHSLASLRHKP